MSIRRLRISINGSETKVEGLGGQNVAVKNLSGGTVWVSAFPNVAEGADNVAEIPPGGGEVILDAHGTVYLLGTGKVQCTGKDNPAPNFNQPSLSAGGGGINVETDRKIIENLIVPTIDEVSRLLDDIYS